MVRALASHQCVPGSIPGPGVICGLSLLLVLALLRGFFSGFSGFLLSSKTNISKSNSIGNSRATGLSVEDCYVLPSLNKVNLFLFIFMSQADYEPTKLYNPRQLCLCFKMSLSAKPFELKRGLICMKMNL